MILGLLDFPSAQADHAAMPTLALPFPDFDPVLFSIGPFAIRWYALAYIGGILLGWWLARHIAANTAYWGGTSPIRPVDVDDVIVWCALGIVLGGRLGYVLFYQPAYYAAHPLEIFVLWRGGMSFHGGLLGIGAAIWLFCRRHRLPVVSLMDLAAAVGTIGLFFGRIANFINGELYGRVTDLPWGVVFPHGGPAPRHPSQLYEAALEGALLFLVINYLIRRHRALARPGTVIGVFLAGYGLARSAVELVRVPDPQLGYLWGGLTMGMLLSLPMILLGAVFLMRARAHGAARP